MKDKKRERAAVRLVYRMLSHLYARAERSGGKSERYDWQKVIDWSRAYEVQRLLKLIFRDLLDK